ncbi:MAG TPA: peptidase M17 [Bacteroidales bacterium]|mgnify:FL=1|nr:peptidase M17 [Bacteroidales bacterium]
MKPKIVPVVKHEAAGCTVYLVSSPKDLPAGIFSKPELTYIRHRKEEKADWIPFDRLGYWDFVQFIKEEKDLYRRLEELRKAGDRLQAFLNKHKVTGITISGPGNDPLVTLTFAEGVILGDYRFSKYKTTKDDSVTLEEIRICTDALPVEGIALLDAVTDGVYFARDLINEPNSGLTAGIFAHEITEMGKSCGVEVEVMNKNKLEALQMGGILGVNKGSHEPPLMVCMEYKPSHPKNKNPFVLVGKGIMFDTGGMNLKPGDYMNDMKDDMSGGAAVAGAMMAIARAKLPVHIIGLVPATDNRPGEQAIVSGDVLRMHNGKTVEVINTDAEGRLILADALSYASRYKPALVIDLATLTGSALRAVGKGAIAGMQAGATEWMDQLIKSGFAVHERIVELPLWDDYAEALKSEVADMKNLGGPEAGAIIAGKFLEKFTSYPFIHLDIAGPAFLDKRDHYRGIGGTGVGVRLLFHFFSTKTT